MVTNDTGEGSLCENEEELPGVCRAHTVQADVAAAALGVGSAAHIIGT